MNLQCRKYKPLFEVWFCNSMIVAGHSCPLSSRLSSTSARWLRNFFSVMQSWLVGGLLGYGQRSFTSVMVNGYLGKPWRWCFSSWSWEATGTKTLRVLMICITSLNAFQEWATSQKSCYELDLQDRLSTVRIQKTTTCWTLLDSSLSSIVWLHFDVMHCSGLGRPARLL